MGVDFFVTWVLWQQMTFVLGVAIGLVFIAGLIKLWWMNKEVAKHAKLDEEKKSRLSDIESTGLILGKKTNIPFGIRAIQKGVEVDGIWISRPGTPNSETNRASTPVNFNSKGKEIVVRLSGSSSGSPRLSPLLPKPLGVPRNSYQPKRAPPRPAVRANESFNAEALRSLEGPALTRPGMQTYTPSTAHGDQVKSPYGDNTRANEYPGYYAERDPRDPFATPDPSERSSPSPPDETSPVHNSGTMRVNFQLSPPSRKQPDLESGEYSHHQL